MFFVVTNFKRCTPVDFDVIINLKLKALLIWKLKLGLKLNTDQHI